jgi:Tol biopolymer transport system component
MRKIILLGVVCSISMLASAQLLEIVSTQQLKTPQNEEMKVAGFSPKGDYVLLTNDVYKGLLHYDLATNNVTTITEADGAGWAVKISTDGTNIVYRERYMTADKLMKHNILEYNLTAKKKAMVAKEQRNLNKLVATNNGVSINENLHMVLIKDGKSTILTPNGANEAYNWASLSPDGQKILYYVSGKGCYTCDLNGRDIHYIALDCRAPQWYDNNIIIGMHDEDNGKWITASAIVAYTLDGRHQELTKKELVAMYPHVSEGMITFATANGDTYLMNVK